MSTNLFADVVMLVQNYDPSRPAETCDALRALWLRFEPKSMAGIKAEQRAQQETAGTPVAVLREIGAGLGKAARKRIAAFIPLAQTLWDRYGREGRVVAVYLLGPMELADPETMVPLVRELCRSCITWEDADQLAMRALEPIVRKRPGEWLERLEPWLEDDSKWVRRSAATVIGRLPMKHAEHTVRCLEMVECLLPDEETDVRRAVSFAIRLSARGDVAAVRDLLARNVPPGNPRATWVLCDVIRSMTKRTLPELGSLLARYRAWAQDPDLDSRDRRSVESAIKTLESAQEVAVRAECEIQIQDR